MKKGVIFKVLRYICFTYVFTIGLMTIVGMGSGGGNSDSSGCSQQSSSPYTPDTTPPTKPENIVANAVNSTQIDLSWDASTDNGVIAGYNIYRDGLFLKSVPGTSASDIGLNPVTDYCYTVSAYDSAGNESTRSNQACATTLVDIPPTIPTNLMANVISTAQIDLSWDASTDDYGVIGYNIYRDGIYLNSVTETSASDIGLSPVTEFCYTVSAYDVVGNESAQSSQACALTPPDLSPPTAPLNLVAIITQPDLIKFIKLRWQPSSDDGAVMGYYIYRDGLYYDSVTNTSYYDTEFNEDTRYCYEVSAYDAAGKESERSNQACTMTGWNFTHIAGGDNKNPSIAIDSADYVHIAYYHSYFRDYWAEYPFTGRLRYATNVSGSWTTHLRWSHQFINRGTGSMSSSIATDSTDNVHISFTVEPDGYFGYLTNGLSHFVYGISSIHTDTSIAVDSADNVHIVYSDYADLNYLTNVSGEWITVKIDNTLWSKVYPSIAVDSADNLHVSYYDIRNHDLKYATNVSGTWVIDVIDYLDRVGSFSSIALDLADNVHIAYRDDTNKKLKYATNASGLWVVETIDNQEDVGSCSSLAVDYNGNLIISYIDNINDILKYATNERGGWDIYTLFDAEDSFFGNTSIAVDSTNKVHIVFVVDFMEIRYATNR